MRRNGDESEDGQSSNTQKDQDSVVSFEEKIDTTAIEEEDWIEHIKGSTNDAMEKMENAKIRCWNKTHKKRNITEGEMVDGCSRMDTRTQLKIQDQLSDWETKKKDGKMTSTNSSNLLRTRQKTLVKAAAKSTKHGSTAKKPAEDGLSKPTSEIRQRSETER